ncbi:MAG TPA: 3-deoxy-manno-octulosonate cytidylyltransferase [Abditibacteriaceae bacterium]|nr:3-deoxy-manno-octulosonate cytidylyltransferase [Abditibacteriaceae bacterium]
MNSQLISGDNLAAWCEERRARGQKVVSTNGCFDVLHAGHIELLQHARTLGDCLLVALNSDASVRRLKGESRPINDESARAFVLGALECVDGVVVFDEDTPVRVLEEARPNVHVKGGDYQIEDLPEAEVVQKHGGEIVIVPLRQGFSTTGTLQKMAQPQIAQPQMAQQETRCLVVIPSRYGSTRFPGKPLANLGSKTVVEHVVGRALETQADRPVLVATDDNRIARQVEQNFSPETVRVVMTPHCETGTDRIAQAILEYSNQGHIAPDERLIVVNVQGDEPFVNAAHLDALIQAMRDEPALKMATLATPIVDDAQIGDPNVVKVVCDQRGNALYFSRCSVPFERDAPTDSSTRTSKLRHVGVYAYDAKWLQEMAQLPPSPLEQTEKLEQLRALEHGVAIRVIVVQDVVNIAIDTPQDLVAAQQYLKSN